jgi:tryptophan synthase alpha chain
MTEPVPRGRQALAAAFEAARREGRAAIVPYLTAGFPTREATLALLDAADRGGADLIELGIPFSDPIADGPTIQRSSQVALAGGFRVADAFAVLREFRARSSTPVLVFSYLNPLLALGGELAARLRDAGADGALLVDLAFEDSEPLRQALAEADLAWVPLVAPTTSDARLGNIAAAASGFIYVVSMAGVTGQHLSGFDEVRERVARIRRVSRLPVAIGFGVQTGADVAALAAFADGVVIGSEVVRVVGGALPEDAPAALEAYVRELRRHALAPAR